MAQRVILIDDLDGSQDSVVSTSFGWDGDVYEIDLTEDNRTRLYETLAPYMSKARLVERNKRRHIRPVATSPATNGMGRQYPSDRLRSPREVVEANRLIRAWANKHGFHVAPRGVISAEVISAYEAATNGRTK